MQELGRTLLDHGISERLSAPVACEVKPGPYIREKDPETKYLNGPAIRDYSLELAEKVTAERARGRTAILLGGDCSILLGALVALRREGTPRLFYLDGHQDYYDGEGDHSGEVADMCLGIATGAMHPLLSNIEALSPYVKVEHAVAFGYRDTEEIVSTGGRTLEGSGIPAYDLARIRRKGLETALDGALDVMGRDTAEPIWLHCDTDVVDDGLNPAVDYRLLGGFDWSEVAQTLRAVRGTGRLAGVSVSIFNPRRDHDGRIAMAITQCLVDGLRD
ncbi:MAG: arginase family protein [Pseudomonadota bacterium]